jgi:hypothetical protein
VSMYEDGHLQTKMGLCSGGRANEGGERVRVGRGRAYIITLVMKTGKYTDPRGLVSSYDLKLSLVSFPLYTNKHVNSDLSI